MPAADYKPEPSDLFELDARRAVVERFNAEMMGAHGLHRSVEALREEIAALRAELRPMPSLILTGRAVVEELERLRIAGLGRAGMSPPYDPALDDK